MMKWNTKLIQATVLGILCLTGNSLTYASVPEDLYQLPATRSQLAGHIDSILNGKRMTVGIYAETGGKQIYARNENMHFPLMSVFKIQVALSVLHNLYTHRIQPDTLIHIERKRILENTYSPMRADYPAGDIELPVSKLINYAVSESDNNACDILLGLAGGPQAVDKYTRSLGIEDFRIAETEASMHEDPSRVYGNWCTPQAMNSLLKLIDCGRTASYDRPLRSAMSQVRTGKDKMAAGIPRGALLLHKTGSSDRINGIKTADNDVGIVRLPDSGGSVLLTIFIKESAETDATNAAVTAAITRAILTETLGKKAYGLYDILQIEE